MIKITYIPGEIANAAIDEHGNRKPVTRSQHIFDDEQGLTQAQINAIVLRDAINVSLSADKSAIFVGEDVQVGLTATSDTDATLIKIYKGDVHLATGSGRTCTATSREIPQSAGNISYRAEFTFGGIQKQATRTITAVYPVYYGAGTSYAETTTVADTVPHIAGSFTKQITTADGDYLFIEVPDNFNLTSIKLVSTYETSLGFTQIESTRAGYKAYKNNDARGAGTYTYKFTIANA